jgi:hypothetical protein
MWWKRLLNRVVRTTVPERLQLVSFNIPGWVEQSPAKGMRLWRAPDGDVLSLAMLDESTAPSQDFRTIRPSGDGRDPLRKMRRRV